MQPFKESTRIPDKTFPINIFFPTMIPSHWHDHMEWLFVRDGKVQAQIDASYSEMHSGELAFINPNQIHSFIPITDNVSMVAIVFNEALIRNAGMDSTQSRYFTPMLDGKKNLPNFLSTSDSLNKQICTCIMEMIDEIEAKKLGFELFIKSNIYRIFGLIFRNNGLLAIKSSSVHNESLAKLLLFLRKNYNQNITVKDAAAIANMSPTYFCCIFKKTTGKTLIQYVNMLRIEESARLLNESRLSIIEISDKVGFSNSTYFGRVFHKYMNICPSSLRRN